MQYFAILMHYMYIRGLGKNFLYIAARLYKAKKEQRSAANGESRMAKKKVIK